MNKVSFTVLVPYDTSVDTLGINYLKKFHLVAIDFVDGDIICLRDAQISLKL